MDTTDSLVSLVLSSSTVTPSQYYPLQYLSPRLTVFHGPIVFPSLASTHLAQQVPECAALPYAPILGLPRHGWAHVATMYFSITLALQYPLILVLQSTSQLSFSQPFYSNPSPRL